MGGQLVLNAVIAAAHYGFIALTFAYVSRVARFFHVAHGAMYALAAYATMSLAGAGLGIVSASLLAVLAVAAAGCAAELAVFRPLRRRRASSEMMLLASFGILVVLQNSFSIVWGDARQAVIRRVAEPGISVLGGRVTEIQLVGIAVSLVASVALIAFSKVTFSGLVLRAVANDPDLARIHGIHVERAIVVGFGIASGLMGLAGVLQGLDSGVTPATGFHALLVAFAGALIGGLHSDERAFAGGAVIGVLEQVAAMYLPGQWYESVILGLLVLAIIGGKRKVLGGLPR